MTFNRFFAIVVTISTIFFAGYMVGMHHWNQQRELESLRRRVRETELIMWSWRGEMDAFREIGVEIRMIDASAHANAMWVREFLEASAVE